MVCRMFFLSLENLQQVVSTLRLTVFFSDMLLEHAFLIDVSNCRLAFLLQGSLAQLRHNGSQQHCNEGAASTCAAADAHTFYVSVSNKPLKMRDSDAGVLQVSQASQSQALTCELVLV